MVVQRGWKERDARPSGLFLDMALIIHIVQELEMREDHPTDIGTDREIEVILA